MSRMDRPAARTPADLDRRYQFGRSFAELEGIVLDAQTHAAKAEEIANQVKLEFDSFDIDVVGEINASADIITLNSNRLVVNSDNFSLTADGVIKTKRGVIGNWDISNDFLSGTKEDTTTIPYESIYTKVYRTVKLQAPDNEAEHILSAAMMLSDEAESVVSFENLYITANGEFLSRKINRIDGRVLFATNPDYVQISDGKIKIKSEYEQTLDNYRSYLLLTYTVEDELFGLYALFRLNNGGEWEYYSTRCSKIE